MAVSNPKNVFSFTAEEAIATQYLIAKVGASADGVGIADTPNTDIQIGIMQDTADSGDSVSVATSGISKVKVGTGGVTKGEKLMAESGGTAITGTTGKACIGIALETGAASDIIPCLVVPEMYQV